MHSLIHLKHRMIQDRHISKTQWVCGLIAHRWLSELRDIAGHAQQGGGRVVRSCGGQVAVAVLRDKVRLDQVQIKDSGRVAW